MRQAQDTKRPSFACKWALHEKEGHGTESKVIYRRKRAYPYRISAVRSVVVGFFRHVINGFGESHAAVEHC